MSKEIYIEALHLERTFHGGCGWVLSDAHAGESKDPGGMQLRLFVLHHPAEPGAGTEQGLRRHREGIPGARI